MWYNTTLPQISTHPYHLPTEDTFFSSTIQQFYIFDDKDAKKKVRRSGAQIKVQPLLGKETETADFCAASSEIDRSAEISCSGILS